MKEYEKIFKDLKALLTITVMEFFKQYRASNPDPDKLLNDTVTDFLFSIIDGNLDEIYDSQDKAMQVLTAVFMVAFINLVEKEYGDEEKEIE